MARPMRLNTENFILGGKSEVNLLILTAAASAVPPHFPAWLLLLHSLVLFAGLWPEPALTSEACSSKTSLLQWKLELAGIVECIFTAEKKFMNSISNNLSPF